jgi:2-polyprenyl-3-methyl-5-hydroxy-6-metoxy-1,4-benzoquinol methylase
VSVAWYARAAPVLAPVPGACPLCGATRLALRFGARGPAGQKDASAYRCTSFGHRSHGPIWACLDCGLLFQWPQPDPAALVSAYAEVVDPVYMAERENRLLTFRRVLRLLGPSGGRRLLDVGAYCGYFLEVAREGGFRVEGLELSRWAVEHARALGLAMRSETLEEHARSGERYQVVTMWDVVEHFADPRAELAAAFQLLEPGGRLWLSTLDTGSLAARLLGARWPWLMDMHLFYFDRPNLSALLEETGFRVVVRRSYTHTVSADYLLRKLAASFPALAPLAWVLRRLVPARWPVPVNLGDNMLLAAERP